MRRTRQQECQRALQHLADVIMLEGPKTIAAVILESVVGTNGILVPPPGYLAGVRALCDQYGIVFIADEVMSGFARCGEWFAIDHWQVVPDLITFAKGVNSGYVPLGGVVINDAIADAFATVPYPGGLTYSGHVLACAAAVANMKAYEDEGTMAHVRRVGEDVVRPALESIAASHPSVGEVRGLGMFWAIELVRDPQTREPLVPFNAAGPEAAPMARAGDGGQGARAVPVHPLQPDARRAALQHPRGRPASRAADHRRGPRARGSPRAYASSLTAHL